MRVFIQRGKKQPLEWRIWVDGDTVHMESGVKDGKMKHTSDVPGSIGKVGTKAYKDPETYAQEIALRQIREKVDRLGYREVDPDTYEFLEDQSDDEIDWRNPPKNMRFMKCRHQPKPDEKKKLAELMKVVKEGNPIFTAKRDGMMHPIFIDEKGGVHIFTRRFDRCTDNYPHIRKEVEAAEFPTRTILLCEFVCVRNKRDDRRLVQTLDRSLPDRAQKIQEDPFRRPKAIVLGIPYWDGKPIMATKTCDEWIEFLHNKLDMLRARNGLTYLEPMGILVGDLDGCMEVVEDEKLEGLVIYDGDAIFGDAVVNFRGREERPRAWKWKPILEGDFVVVFDPDGEFGGGFDKNECGKWGRGRLQKLPGNVALFQYDSSNMMHYICNVGSGFTEAQRKDLLKRARKGNGYAGVAEIKYESRTFISDGDDTNALTAPIFLRWRDDKELDEAVEERLD